MKILETIGEGDTRKRQAFLQFKAMRTEQVRNQSKEIWHEQNMASLNMQVSRAWVIWF